MNIRPVTKGTNRYCGPAVISALTGMDTGEAARQIRKLTGRRQVIRTTLQEVLMVLNQYGIKATWLYRGEQVPVKKRPIAVVSLGAEREIWFKPQGSKGLDEVDKLLLKNGSICVMAPGMQDTHYHRIPKHPEPCGHRISLTFRGYVPVQEGITDEQV